MFSTPLFLAIVGAVSFDATLLRLEPAEPIELEALATIRTDADFNWADGRIDRSAPATELQTTALSLSQGKRMVVWVKALSAVIEVHVLSADGRERVRMLPFRAESSSAAVSENIAALVRSQMATLREAEKPDTEEPPVAEKKPEPVRPAEPGPVATAEPSLTSETPASARRFQATLGYLGGSLGAGFGWQQGGRLSLSFEVWRLRIRAALEVFFPAQVRRLAADFDVNRQALVASVGPWWRRGPFRMGAEVGVAAERLQRSVSRVQVGTATSESIALLPSGLLLAGVGFSTGRWGVELATWVKGPVRPVDYQSTPEGSLAQAAAFRVEGALSLVLEL